MLSFKQIAVTLDEREVGVESSSTARVNDAVIAVAGEAWGGVLMLNGVLHQIMARLGLAVRAFPTFPPEIRGGPCNVVASVKESTPDTHGYEHDIVVAFTARDVADFQPHLKPNGVLVYDSSGNKIYVPPKEGQVHYAVPFQAIAESVGEVRPNVVALGVLTSLFRIPYEMSEALIREEFGGKGADLVARNLRALKAGFKYAQSKLRKADPYLFEASGGEPLLLVPGNEAAALGLIAAGLRRFFGYPITPSSEGFLACMKWLFQLGGRAVQMENEDASILAAIGSFFAGLKTATFTSGPGLSRMAEGLSLAYMMEIPAVVVNSMRGGPSTGLPTKTEQSDLLSAIFAPHGDAANVVLAAASVEDAFYMAILAMNLATKHQTPVVLLIDQALSLGYQTMRRPDLSKIQVEELRRPTAKQLSAYQRYLRDPDGVAPMAIPGHPGGRHRITGLEHDVAGRPSSSAQTHVEMSEARRLKIAAIARDPLVQGIGRRFGSAAPRIGVISWGTTEGAICEAVTRARGEGLEVAFYQPRLMWPFDPGVIEFAASVETVIVPEQNQGQFRLLLNDALHSARISTPTVPVNELTGLPMRPEVIYQAIKQATVRGAS